LKVEIEIKKIESFDYILWLPLMLASHSPLAVSWVTHSTVGQAWQFR